MKRRGKKISFFLFSTFVALLITTAFSGASPTAQAAGSVVAYASNPNIVYWGRWSTYFPSTTSPATTADQGAYFLVKFAGATQVTLNFSGNRQVLYKYYSPAGDLSTTVGYPDGNGNLTIYGLSDTTQQYVLEVFADGNSDWTGNNLLYFNQITLYSGSQNPTILAADGFLRSPDLSIEFMGDSIVTGNESTSYTIHAALDLNFNSALTGNNNYSVEYSNWGLAGRGIYTNGVDPIFGAAPASADPYDIGCVSASSCPYRANSANSSTYVPGLANLEKLPNVVVISLGANDAIHQVTADQYGNALDDFMKRLINMYGYQVHIYVVRPLPCFDDDPILNGACDPNVSTSMFGQPYINAIQSKINYAWGNYSTHITYVNTNGWFTGCDNNYHIVTYSPPNGGPPRSECLHLSSTGANLAGIYLSNQIAQDLRKDGGGNTYIVDRKGF